MSYINYFSCGRDSAEVRTVGFISAPDALRSAEQIAANDKTAAWLIAQCTAIIENMQEYRQALTARYNALATMPSTQEIKLERYPYTGKVSYYVRVTTVYEDGTRNETFWQRYTGKERAAAIAHYGKLCRQYPTAAHIKDIARKPWEK